ncbi:MAG: iron ABC transporter permease [Candidatus Cloacimonetes bacterium]|nr:iron ABC transporter permease [Candidatus Cloacimonadota bacterium]
MKNRYPVFILMGFLLLATVYLYLSFRIASLEVMTSIRFPRFLLTYLTGFLLAGVGYSYQIMLNNPLAEPYILGVSSGAAFGSILASVIGFHLLQPLFGFVGALVAMIMVWKLANLGGYFSSTKLLLSGIILGMFFSALISVIMYFHQRDISTIVSVLMGNLGHVFAVKEWAFFRGFSILSLMLMTFLFTLAEPLRILTTGDLMASSLGVDVRKLRLYVFLSGSLLTGFTVAYAGIIGFVGLIIPHLVRMLIGGERRGNMALAALLGGWFLLICDFIAQHIAVVEIPVGIVTAFIGCPFFIYLLSRNK